MKRTITLIIASIMVSTLSCQQREVADLIIINGKVFTVDESNPEAEAIAVKGEKIIAVGSTKEIKTYAAESTQVIDASGKLIPPGFNDAHVHFGPLDPDFVELRYITDRNIITQRVKEQVAKSYKGQLISGGHWDHELFSDRKWPSKENVLMAVAPGGRAFAILRELNKGLPKDQRIKEDDFNRKLGDLDRDKLKSVKQVQFETHKRLDLEEQQRKWIFGNARYEAREEERKARRLRVFDRWSQRKRDHLESRQEQEQKRTQAAADARMEQARQEALKAQQVRQQQQALKMLDARMKKGGVVYRLSGKAKQDQEDREVMQERLDRSRQRVEGWVDRERRRSEPELTALQVRHEAERVALEAKVEEARKIMEGREGQPERVVQQQRAEPGERREQGRTLGR